jgi:hypothetical protein
MLLLDIRYLFGIFICAFLLLPPIIRVSSLWPRPRVRRTPRSLLPLKDPQKLCRNRRSPFFMKLPSSPPSPLANCYPSWARPSRRSSPYHRIPLRHHESRAIELVCRRLQSYSRHLYPHCWPLGRYVWSQEYLHWRMALVCVVVALSLRELLLQLPDILHQLSHIAGKWSCLPHPEWAGHTRPNISRGGRGKTSHSAYLAERLPVTS